MRRGQGRLSVVPLGTGVLEGPVLPSTRNASNEQVRGRVVPEGRVDEPS